MEANTKTPPAIEWPAPTINNVSNALDEVSCQTERLKALLDSNTADFQEAFIDQQGGLSPWQQDRAYALWMIFITAGEKLAEIDKTIAAISTEVPYEPTSPVGKHTRIRRSQDWRAAADALNAANSSDDTSNEAFDAAGAAFTHMLETRVSSPAEFREKLMLISATRHGVQDSDVNELFRDLDALGWRAVQGEG